MRHLPELSLCSQRAFLVVRGKPRKESCHSRQRKFLRALNPNAWVTSGLRHTDVMWFEQVGCDILHHLGAGLLFLFAFGAK